MGQRGLAGSRAAADQDQPDRARPQMCQCDPQMPAGIGAGLGMTLGDPHAVHLGAHSGAIGDIEVAQRCRRIVGGHREVAAQKELSEFRPAEELQVHGQERGVVDDVDVAQPVVELQTVQQGGTVGQAEDIVSQQIGVSIDDPGLGDSSVEERGPSGGETRCQTGDLGDFCRIKPGNAVVGVPREFVEVVRPSSVHRRHPGLVVDLAGARRAGVEPRQHRRHCVELAAYVVTATHHGGQPVRVGVASHHNHRFGGAVRGTEVPHPQVAVRCQPAVEHDLVRTGPLPAGDGGEIQKVGHDRLLDLVGPIPDQEDQAGVRLDDVVHRPPLAPHR